MIMGNGQRPRVSIVIPLYNKEATIKRSLRSVLNQNFKDYEIVVVDDGSTDNSFAKVQSINDDKIRVVSQSNSGVAVARNTGINVAKGEYIAFLDADDEWSSDYLSSLVNLTKEFPEASVFASNYQFRNSSKKIIPSILNHFPFDTKTGILSNYFEVAAISHPPLWTSAVMVRKDAILSVGGFPKGVKSGEDLLTWARLAVRYPIAYSKDVNATYNLGDGYDFSKLPPRRQDEGDPVGAGLKQLYRDNKKIKGLRRYISHWHKMRASVAIRYGERMETLKEVSKSLFYNPLNRKVIPFAVLAFLPSKLRKGIISQHIK